DTNGQIDVFVHDLQTGVTERVSLESSGNQGNDLSLYPSLSSDGRFVTFRSLATNLVAGDGNGAMDSVVRDRTTKTTDRASVDSSGGEANSDSYNALAGAISADGSVVTFYSDASNLVAGDTNGVWDVFVHDRNSGLTTRVSVDSSGAEADGQSE